MLTFNSSDDLIGYINLDFANCIDDLRSTSGYIFILIGGAISWKSAKETITASSTMQPDFIICYEATIQAIPLKNLITGLQVVDSIRDLIKICLNSLVVFPLNNNKKSNGSKDLEIKYLVVRDKVKKQ